MIDDDFDDLLRDASQTYNTPPEPPREAMWAAIAAARDSATVVPIGAARPVRRWIPMTAAAAAVLLAGMAIGRFTRSGDVTNGVVTTASAPAQQPAVTDSVRPLASTDVASIDDSTAAAPQGAGATNERLRSATQRTAATAVQRGARADGESAAGDRAGATTAYRFAVVEHLTRAEVLLTGFRAQARTADGAKLDAQLASLARELLGTTRLLLATHGSDDPAVTRLLEDLELVLMQLTQYARDGRRIDLDAINQSLDKRNVLPKLRSTIPAGVSASAGT